MAQYSYIFDNFYNPHAQTSRRSQCDQTAHPDLGNLAI